VRRSRSWTGGRRSPTSSVPSAGCATWSGGEQLAAEGEHDAGERRGEGGKHRVGAGTGESDGEASALAAGGAPRGVDGGEDLAPALEEHRAGRSELDAARGPVGQRFAELGLKAADLLRQRRLGDVKALGGAAEVPLLGDRDEVAEVSQLHGSPVPIHIEGAVNQHNIGVARDIAAP
jgi:hypothetical protein